MAVSLVDFALREMHVAYFRNMQALVTDLAESDCVVLFNIQPFALDDASGHETRSLPRYQVSC